VFSALSVPWLYNASSGEFSVEFRGSGVNEQKMARRFDGHLKCYFQC
jgi:hypothetical protein